MKSLTIQTRIEGGKFKMNTKAIKKAIEAFEGKQVDLIFKRRYKPRSLPQNAFYWGVIIPFFANLFLEEWNEIKSPTEVHEILKAACNYQELVNEATGETIRIPKSTTDLSTGEWLEYEKKIEQLSLDFFNTPLPVPNEQTELWK